MSDYIQKLFKTGKNPNCTCPGIMVFELNDPDDAVDGVGYIRATVESVVSTGTAESPCYHVNYKFPKTLLISERQEVWDFCSMVKAWSCESLAIRYADQLLADTKTDGGLSLAAFAVVGSGTPGDGVGIDGQLYFDKLGLQWWGPKANGTWTGTGPFLMDGGGAPATPGGTQEEKTTYTDVGTHILTKPSGATVLFIKSWGPGGGSAGGGSGGVGAYSQAEFDVTSETSFLLNIGIGGNSYDTPSGYTGLFFGGSQTLASARLIAGGGGGGNTYFTTQNGYPGNFPSYSGGHTNFTGEGGGRGGHGGGGYVGGSQGIALANQEAGNGGTSYIHSSGTNPLMLNAAREDVLPPNNTDSDYTGTYGRAGQGGLAVVEWQS